MMQMRNLRRLVTRISCSSRLMSSNSNQLTVSVDEKGVANLHLHKKPVNSLSYEFLVEIRDALDKIHNDKNIRGLVLRSDIPKIFSAGLEITEMFNPEESRLREFWRAHQDCWLRLFGSHLVTIAAIDGHAPAGGCGFANTTDYRIMSNAGYRIGLNETLLGIVAPFWFTDNLERIVGARQCERLLQLGHMCDSDEALKIGLVDQVVNPSDMYTTVDQVMQQWLKVHPGARFQTKMYCRQFVYDKLKDNKEADIDHFASYILTDAVQKPIGRYLEILKNKSKK